MAKYVYIGKRATQDGKLTAYYRALREDGTLDDIDKSIGFSKPLVKWHGIGQVYEIVDKGNGRWQCNREVAATAFPETAVVDTWWADAKAAEVRVRMVKDAKEEKSRDHIAEYLKPIMAMMAKTDATGRRMIKVMVLEALDQRGSFYL